MFRKRVHFAPTKTVYSAPHIPSSDASSIASSSPAFSPSAHATLPSLPLHSVSPGSSSSAELSTPPPPPEYYHAGGNTGYAIYGGGYGYERREQQPEARAPAYQYQYSPQPPAHVHAQYVLDQSSSGAVYPRTPFHPSTHLDFEQDHHGETYPYHPSPDDVHHGYHFAHSRLPSPSPPYAYPATPDLYLSKPVIPSSPSLGAPPPGQAHIHYLLAFTPYSEPAFSCDLSRPPPHLTEALARFNSGKIFLDAQYSEGGDVRDFWDIWGADGRREDRERDEFEVFYEPATSPPMNSLVITHPTLKFAVDVSAGADISRPRPHPRRGGHYPRAHYGHGHGRGYGYDDGYGSSSSSSSSDEGDSKDDFVTVADVLVSLYRELRLAIHPVDYAELHPDAVKRVNEAYYTRCAAAASTVHADRLAAAGMPLNANANPKLSLDWGEAERLRAAEEKKGIRKVDLLMGQTWFVGLSGTLHGPGVWELNVAA